LTAVNRSIEVQAQWDDEEGLWLATSRDVPGLAIEADTWALMIEEVKMNLPELLDWPAGASSKLTVTFKAEERLDLTNP
jgi:hypothetical protein